MDVNIPVEDQSEYFIFPRTSFLINFASIAFNTKISLLTMGRNSYQWKFQQNVEKPDLINKKYIDVVYQNLKDLFNIKFRVLLCKIQMVFF